MSIITVFHGTFCREGDVIQKVLDRTGYRRVSDEEVAVAASRISGIAESKIMNAFSAKTSVFNKFTHEKERSIAYLRLAVAEMLALDDVLLAGFSGQLIPRKITHVLRVCLIAEMKIRIQTALDEKGLSMKEATNLVHKQEDDCLSWFDTFLNEKDPWNASLHDIVIPTDKMSADDAAELVAENVAKDVLKPTEASRRMAEEFLLASQVGVALAKEGHNVDVAAAEGTVTLTINKQVLMLSRLEEELKTIVGALPGVQAVETRVGKDFHQADVYRKYNFEVPSKVLLVDDEREFVQTLSERLYMRDMGSAVAYDGESALNLVKDDEPDVMILDLKMPGIDGIEVLRRVKATQPEIEVIILTGHGSEEDRLVCMQLGAFAYLQKPVDIDVLSRTLREANEKARHKKKDNG